VYTDYPSHLPNSFHADSDSVAHQPAPGPRERALKMDRKLQKGKATDISGWSFSSNDFVTSWREEAAKNVRKQIDPGVLHLWHGV
jgi:hypothetical protein